MTDEHEHNRCGMCGDQMNWATGPEYENGVCIDCMRWFAAPEQLRMLAEWFDDPNQTPGFSLDLHGPVYTPGMLLRRIADDLAEKLSRSSELTPTADKAPGAKPMYPERGNPDGSTPCQADPNHSSTPPTTPTSSS